MGHRLDREVERIYDISKKGKKGRDITNDIEDNIRLENVLESTSWLWDGGYVICGLTGSGESLLFVIHGVFVPLFIMPMMKLWSLRLNVP